MDSGGNTEIENQDISKLFGSKEMHTALGKPIGQGQGSWVNELFSAVHTALDEPIGQGSWALPTQKTIVNAFKEPFLKKSWIGKGGLKETTTIPERSWAGTRNSLWIVLEFEDLSNVLLPCFCLFYCVKPTLG